MGLSIPIAWKVGLIGFGLLAFTAGIGGSYVYTLNFGEEKCKSEVIANNLQAENENLKKTLKDIQNGIANLQSLEDAINAEPGENPELGPRMRAQLDRMRSVSK